LPIALGSLVRVLGTASRCTYCDDLLYVMHCVLSLNLYRPAHRHTLDHPIWCPHPDRSLPGIWHVFQQL
jgi:hypothetical protein